MDPTTLRQQVLTEINAEALAADLLAFLQVRSETGTEGDGSRFLADLLHREGFDPHLDDVEPNRPNVYARLQGLGAGGWGLGEDARTPERPVQNRARKQAAAPSSFIPHPSSLLLNGHTDTIPVGQSWPPRREGDWVVGRGAEDMKGGLVAMVHAASALRKAGVQLGGDLWLTGVIGHETPIGKKEGPRRLIRRFREGAIAADGILIVEGPPKIWAASLGSAVFSITVTSPRGAIHTLHVPYSENPALWVGHLLVKLGELDRALEAAPHHPLCGRERLNVGTVHGGDYMNRLPTPLTVTGQRRWMPGKTASDVQAGLESLGSELAQESGLTFNVTLEGQREPFETPGDHPLVRSLETAGEVVAGETPERIGMALVGDANLYANDGAVPTVYYGPAYRTAHSDDERVEVRQLVHCAQVYALAAMEFCGVA